MKSHEEPSMKKLPVAVAVWMVMFSTTSVGSDKEPAIAQQAQPGEGLTVYIDVSFGGRKKKAAARMTELHREFFAKGWTVIDVDPYIENGDLQGFFITYVGRD